MKNFVSAVLAFLVGCSSDARSETPTVDEIRKLPKGIDVTHNPNPVAAVKGGRSGRAFTWEYQTSVVAIEKEVTIVEFGSFFESDGKWVFANYTGKPFTGKDFAEWYSCPEARVRPGSPAKDPKNWGGGDQLRTAKALWYFIGRDADGNRYRGEAIVEQLPKVGP